MPYKNTTLNLPGFTVQKVTGFKPIVIHCRYQRQARCPHCECKRLRIKHSFLRTVKHEMIGLRQTVLQFKTHKFFCHRCQRYFNQRIPGIRLHQRATEKLREQVFILHNNGISQTDLRQHLNVGKSTVERWYHDYYYRQNQERLHRACPRVLGLDEHRFSRQTRFATTFCDLQQRKVFDVVQGHSGQTLLHYLDQLPAKNRVKLVCMDLSRSYRSLAKQYFPNALIVADRFHVIRLINHACLQTYQQIDPETKHQRGILAILRKRLDNLTELQIKRRTQYFEKQPAVEPIYYFQKRLHRLLTIKHRTKKQCRRLVPIFLKMIDELKGCGFEKLQTLGRTLEEWQEEIARMWRFTKSNGITEGFHRKMKLIQRRAYGFRNFENYRLRVKVLCG